MVSPRRMVLEVCACLCLATCTAASDLPLDQSSLARGNTTGAYKPDADLSAAVADVHGLGGKVEYDLANTVVVVHLNGCVVTDADLKRLQQYRALADLQELKLDHTPVSDEGMSYARQWEHLESLNISMTDIGDQGLEKLKGMDSLESLGVNHTPVTDGGLEHLAGLRSLKSLDLEGTTVTAAGLKHLHGLTNLEKLLLPWTRITDSGLAHLKGLTHLKELVLNHTAITDSGLVYLRGLRQLEELDLEHTTTTDAGLAHLKGLSNLVRLNLRYTQTTISEPAELTGPAKLKWLWPSKPELAAHDPSGGTPDASGAQRQLWIENAYGSDVHVYEVGSFKLLRHIEVGPYPHGISATLDGSTVHVALEHFGESAGELLWIDTRTGRIMDRINVGPQPNENECTPDGKWIYVPCADGKWWVVDGETKQVATKIHTGGRPHNTIVSPDGNRMYLAPLGYPRAVTMVDVRAGHRVIDEIPFANTTRPAAISGDEQFFFQNLDGLLGIQMARIADRRVVHTLRHNIPVEVRPYWSRCHGLGIRPDQKEIWSCNVEHHFVHVHDLVSGQYEETATIPVPGRPYWISMSPDNQYAFVSLRSKRQVAVVDCQSKQIVKYLPAGSAPKRTLTIDVPLD